MGLQVIAGEPRQARCCSAGGFEGLGSRRQSFKSGLRKGGSDAGDLGLGQVGPLTNFGPFSVDLAGKFLGSERSDQDLDPRLILVVPAAVAIVDAQDRLDV